MYSTNYVRRTHVLRALALAIVLYGIGDIATTYAVVTAGGHEMNPIVRAIGPTSFWFVLAKIPVLLIPVGILKLANVLDVDLLKVSALTFALMLVVLGAVATTNNVLVFL